MPHTPTASRGPSVLSRRDLLTLAATVPLVGAATPAWAETGTWPDRPIRIVVPYAPGNISDSSARLISVHLSNALGRQCFIENRTGANTRIGTEYVAKADPDGYTWLYSGPTVTVMAALFSDMQFDPTKSLAPTSMAIANPTVFLVRPDFPAHDMREFIDLSKKNPHAYFIASGGVGTMPHMAMELLVSMAGLKAQHVPYRGGASWQADFMGGQITGIFDNPTSAIPLIKDGRAKALAVTSAQRIPSLPDVPTVAELGVPGFEVRNWFGFFAPLGTPAPLVDKMSLKIAKVMKMPEVDTYFRKLGVTPVGSSPADFSRVVQDDTRKWTQVIKERGIKPE